MTDETNAEREKIKFKADRINLKANVILGGMVAIIIVIASGLMDRGIRIWSIYEFLSEPCFFCRGDILNLNLGLVVGILLFGFLFCWQYGGIRNIPLLGPLLVWISRSNREEDGFSIREQVDKLERRIERAYPEDEDDASSR